MTDEMLHAVLETATAKVDKDGWSVLPDGRLMTLYASHGGVALTMGKIEAIKTSQRVLWARNAKGETYVTSLDALFAASVDRGNDPQTARKAGFLG